MNKIVPKIISLRTSFTADEIVAKMLGWLRGPNFSGIIEITALHFEEKQLILLSKLEVSLEDHLTQLMNAAIEDYNACGDNVPDEIAIVKEEEIERIEALSEKALSYIASIKHELMKGGGSMLAVDPSAIHCNGETYYTLQSADNWTQANHGISIINYVEPVAVPEEDTLVVERDGKGSKKGLSKTVTNNFYSTFALLIEAFIEAKPDYVLDLEKMMAPGYQGQSVPDEEEIKKTKLIVLKLGKYLQYRSMTPGTRKFAPGQGDEAIMTHIENARDYKAKVWEARKAPKTRKVRKT